MGTRNRCPVPGEGNVFCNCQSCFCNSGLDSSRAAEKWRQILWLCKKKQLPSYLTPVCGELPKTKQNKITSASEAVERWGTLVYYWWKCKVVQLLWKAERGYLKIENRITTWSSNHTSGYIPKRIKSRTLKRYLYPHVHSSIVYSSQGVEPSKCPPAGEWISNMLYMPTQWNITQPSKGRAFW